MSFCREESEPIGAINWIIAFAGVDSATVFEGSVPHSMFMLVGFEEICSFLCRGRLSMQALRGSDDL